MNNFDVTTLEEAVIAIVKAANVSSTIYNTRPKAAVSADNFVVVNVSGVVEDNAAYGTCIVGIDLFSKDVNNLKNSAKLKYMYERLIAGFPAKYDVTKTVQQQTILVASYLFDPCFNILGDTPDDYGYHARLINVNATIKVI